MEVLFKLTVLGQDQLDARAPQRFDDIEVLFAWYGEDVLDALVLQGVDEQVACFHEEPLSLRHRGKGSAPRRDAGALVSSRRERDANRQVLSLLENTNNRLEIY